MGLFEVEDPLQGKLLVDVASAVPEDDVVASRLFLEVRPQVAVGGEDHGLVGGDGVYDVEGVGGCAADVGQGFYFGRRVDVADDDSPGVSGPEGRKLGRGARGGQRTTRLGIGDQYFFRGGEDLGRLGHEIDAGEQYDVGVGLRRLLRQRQRVSREIGYLLHLRTGVVVGKDDSVLFQLQIGNLFSKAHFFYFYLFKIIFKKQ